MKRKYKPKLLTIEQIYDSTNEKAEHKAFIDEQLALWLAAGNEIIHCEYLEPDSEQDFKQREKHQNSMARLKEQKAKLESNNPSKE